MQSYSLLPLKAGEVLVISSPRKSPNQWSLLFFLPCSFVRVVNWTWLCLLIPNFALIQAAVWSDKRRKSNEGFVSSFIDQIFPQVLHFKEAFSTKVSTECKESMILTIWGKNTPDIWVFLQSKLCSHCSQAGKETQMKLENWVLWQEVESLNNFRLGLIATLA